MTVLWFSGILTHHVETKGKTENLLLVSPCVVLTVCMDRLPKLVLNLGVYRADKINFKFIHKTQYNTRTLT